MDDLTSQIDKRLDKVEAKIDKVSDTLSEINITLASQHSSLKEHIRRTDLAEEGIGFLRRDLDPVIKEVNMAKGAFKLIGLVCILIGALASIFAMLE